MRDSRTSESADSGMFMGARAIAILASLVTMGTVTVAGVLLFFRPVAESDTVTTAWPPPLALSVYLVLSIALFDWAARRMHSSLSAAVVIAAAQAIFIVDLLSRAERGLMTALAGIALLAVTWLSVAFVHSRFSAADRDTGEYS
jgi:hypothetical protein